ncbi:MAG: hypothetical protein OER80_03960 [Gammaproteobacteria bacterium]|nr:hypothetical protein [Gammaproteobacteria bacterium]MDH3767885.1 hypothetical protein [Gammaproteobacteria bacterium]
MSNEIEGQEEFAMQAMFGREIPPVADDGFSKTVLVRVRRKIWKRRVTLLSATVLGLVIALPTVGQLLLMLSNELVALAARAETSDTLGQLGSLASLLPLRETAQIASDELKNFSAQISPVSWYQQNRLLVGAGLLSLASLFMTHILDR